MKFPTWPRAFAVRSGSAVTFAIQVLLAPIAFREVLLFGGSVLLGYGAGMIYPPAMFVVPGVVLVGVAVFGVR